MNVLHWSAEKGIGYFPAGPIDYGDSYFDDYVKKADTQIGRELTDRRVGLVNEYLKKGEYILDFGIGSGQFVEAAGQTRQAFGYDVMPKAVEWLKNRNLFFNFNTCRAWAVSFWDSLEHLLDPAWYVSRIHEWAFVSIPIFRDMAHCSTSKHMKPGEHIWYFTHEGLIKWFSGLGFSLRGHNVMEMELGREDIGTYVFKKVW